MGEVASVPGFSKLAETLRIGNTDGLKNFPQGLGFRYELEIAAQLKRMGVVVSGLTQKVVTVERKLATDIDIVIVEGGVTKYLQAKRSAVAFGSGKKSEKSIREWVEKVYMETGQRLPESIKYVVPPGTRIPERARNILEVDYGIEVISVSHR